MNQEESGVTTAPNPRMQPTRKQPRAADAPRSAAQLAA